MEVEVVDLVVISVKNPFSMGGGGGSGEIPVQGRSVIKFLMLLFQACPRNPGAFL